MGCVQALTKRSFKIYSHIPYKANLMTADGCESRTYTDIGFVTWEQMQSLLLHLNAFKS